MRRRDPNLPVLRGRIKFWKRSGMGGIESEEAPGDVYVGLAAIDMPGYRELVEGELVEFQYVEASHDSWNYRATWVRPMRFKGLFGSERGIASLTDP
jgi:cold shock CspA family protein